MIVLIIFLYTNRLAFVTCLALPTLDNKVPAENNYNVCHQ